MHTATCVSHTTAYLLYMCLILVLICYMCVAYYCVSAIYVSHTSAYGQVCTYGLRVHAMKASTKSTKNTAEDCRRGLPEGGMRAV